MILHTAAILRPKPTGACKMKLSKYQTERVWKIWVHPYENSVEGEFVKFVTETKYNKLLREFKKLQTQIKVQK